MKIWSVNTPSLIAIVSAEDVNQAKAMILEMTGWEITNSDLVPIITSTRWVRILKGNYGNRTV